jgi:hypothetical protein
MFIINRNNGQPLLSIFNETTQGFPILNGRSGSRNTVVYPTFALEEMPCAFIGGGHSNSLRDGYLFFATGAIPAMANYEAVLQHDEDITVADSLLFLRNRIPDDWSEGLRARLESLERNANVAVDVGMEMLKRSVNGDTDRRLLKNSQIYAWNGHTVSWWSTYMDFTRTNFRELIKSFCMSDVVGEFGEDDEIDGSGDATLIDRDAAEDHLFSSYRGFVVVLRGQGVANAVDFSRLGGVCLNIGEALRALFIEATNDDGTVWIVRGGNSRKSAVLYHQKRGGNLRHVNLRSNFQFGRLIDQYASRNGIANDNRCRDVIRHLNSTCTFPTRNSFAFKQLHAHIKGKRPADAKFWALLSKIAFRDRMMPKTILPGLDMPLARSTIEKFSFNRRLADSIANMPFGELSHAVSLPITIWRKRQLPFVQRGEYRAWLDREEDVGGKATTLDILKWPCWVGILKKTPEGKAYGKHDSDAIKLANKILFKFDRPDLVGTNDTKKAAMNSFVRWWRRGKDVDVWNHLYRFAQGMLVDE